MAAVLKPGRAADPHQRDYPFAGEGKAPAAGGGKFEQHAKNLSLGPPGVELVCRRLYAGRRRGNARRWLLHGRKKRRSKGMFSKSVEDLTSDIRKHGAKEVELIGKRRAAVDRVTAAEGAAGVALLDAAEGESTDKPVAEILRARSEAAAIDVAIRVCRDRRLEAIKGKRAAEALLLQKQAEQLRSQLEALGEKTTRCLGALAELQGMPYSAVPVPTAFGMIPLSAQLQNQIESLEARRRALGGEIPRHGTVDFSEGDATDVAELVAAVLHTEADGPSAEAVIGWANACAGGRQFGASPRRYRLVWQEGVIDAAKSYVYVPSLMVRTVGVTAGTPGFDVSRATFRAPAGWQQPSGSQAQRIRPPEVAAQPEPEPPQAKSPEVAPQPQPQGASQWKDAPRRERDDAPDWVPAPGAGPGARA